jgi:hypothetical protein
MAASRGRRVGIRIIRATFTSSRPRASKAARAFGVCGSTTSTIRAPAARWTCCSTERKGQKRMDNIAVRAEGDVLIRKTSVAFRSWERSGATIRPPITSTRSRSTTSRCPVQSPPASSTSRTSSARAGCSSTCRRTCPPPAELVRARPAPRDARPGDHNERRSARH